MISTVARARRKSGFADAAPLFAALGDETRLSIVARLCHEGPASIARLSEEADVTRQAITKHLRALEDAGLVRSGRAGRECIYELETRRLARVRRYLDQISSQWDDTLERLRAFIEQD